MDAKIKLYQELLMKTLDRRKEVIFTALTLVTGFGVTALVSVFKDIPLVRWRPFEWTKAYALTIAFVVSWSAYFFILNRLERRGDEFLRELGELIGLAEREKALVAGSITNSAKWAPFAISLVLYLAILGPP